MKRFHLRILLFFAIITFLGVGLLYWFPDIVCKNNLYSALPDKHTLLAEKKSPKIILAGGSNVSFGFDSKRISDTYHMPVVNTAITAMFGAKFILQDIEPYVNKGDIVVVSLEYQVYQTEFDSWFEGGEEVLPVLFGIYPQGKSLINVEQWLHLAHYIPHYAFSKLKPIPIIGVYYNRMAGKDKLDVYGRHSFNEYGDAYKHWTQPNRIFEPDEQKCTGKEELNQKVFLFLKDFKSYLSAKGASMVMIPPPLDRVSFENQLPIIKKIAAELKKDDLELVSDPGKYKFPHSYLFNNDYHLNKSGVDIRTGFVIDDLSKLNILNQSK